MASLPDMDKQRAHPAPVFWVVVFSIAGKGFDLASIVMLGGGLFLIYKSVMEIHHKLEGEDPNEALKDQKPLSFGNALGQIMLIDAVFSFDSMSLSARDQAMMCATIKIWSSYKLW